MTNTPIYSTINVMLPYSDDFPAVTAKLLLYTLISASIRVYLPRPESFVSLRLLEVPFTTMPETAVDENHGSIFTKHNIGPTDQIVPDSITKPAFP